MLWLLSNSPSFAVNGINQEGVEFPFMAPSDITFSFDVISIFDLLYDELNIHQVIQERNRSDTYVSPLVPRRRWEGHELAWAKDFDPRWGDDRWPFYRGRNG